MIGAVIVVIAIVLVLPPIFMMTGGIIGAALSYFLKEDVEASHQGSELVDLS